MANPIRSNESRAKLGKTRYSLAVANHIDRNENLIIRKCISMNKSILKKTLGPPNNWTSIKKEIISENLVCVGK